MHLIDRVAPLTGERGFKRLSFGIEGTAGKPLAFACAGGFFLPMNIHKYKLTDAASKGQWFDFDDARFLIASSKSREFTACLARIVRKVPQAKLKADPSIYQDLSIQALAETVLLDWQGVDVHGTPLPCTPENKLVLLDCPELREWISDTAAEMGNFRDEHLAEDISAVKSGAEVGDPVG